MKVIYVVFFLLGKSPASEFCVPEAYNTWKTEQTETSTHKIQTPKNHPKERIQHSEQGESKKSRKVTYI